LRISDEQAQAAYTIARAVYSNELPKAKGAEFLAEKHGLNKNSANDFINNYQCFRQGVVFKRNLKTSFIDYFLSSIFKDNGLEALDNAILALELHIDYWEQLTGTNAISKRELAKRFKSQLDVPRTLEEYQDKFQAEVQYAMSLTRDERQRNMANARTVPLSSEVKTKVFIRNQYVVAERLERAKGVCEGCNSEAPFRRASDGSPYLEVHHIVPLAKGGEDTIQNTIALCPNCHRERHFGEIVT
jgi:5-methylcytosine-specific restriction protein A